MASWARGRRKNKGAGYSRGPETLRPWPIWGTPCFSTAAPKNMSSGPAPAQTASSSRDLQRRQYKTETKVEPWPFIDEHGLEPATWWGTTVGRAAGLGNGFTAVGCTYGYGSKQNSRTPTIIDHISEILDLVGRSKQMIRFGTAGNGQAFMRRAIPPWICPSLAGVGLSAYEYQCGRE